MQQADGKEVSSYHGNKDPSDETKEKDQPEVAQFLVTGLIVGAGDDDQADILVFVIISDRIFLALSEINTVIVCSSRPVDDGPVGADGIGRVVAIPIDHFIKGVIGFDDLVFHGHGGGGVDLSNELSVEHAALTQQPAGRDGPVNEPCLDVLDTVGIREIIDRNAY